MEAALLGFTLTDEVYKSDRVLTPVVQAAEKRLQFPAYAPFPILKSMHFSFIIQAKSQLSVVFPLS